MSACDINGQTDGSGFAELLEAMNDDLYWIRFFVRPCCPAPDLGGAKSMLDRLIREVNMRDDLSTDEKQALVEVIESRKEWYAGSGLCRSAVREG